MILYSFRRCPFAMRARMALYLGGIIYEHREVDLKNKPSSMLSYSPKGTVPILVLPDGQVIDESIQIMKWVFYNQGCQVLRDSHGFTQQESFWLRSFERDFLPWVYRAKYPERYEFDQQKSFEAGRVWLMAYNQYLENTKNEVRYLCFNDLVFFPFVRQWNHIDALALWCEKTRLFSWFNEHLSAEYFCEIMHKFPVYHD